MNNPRASKTTPRAGTASGPARLPHREKFRMELTSGSSSRGAQMGRRNILPAVKPVTIKLHLTRLRWVDGDYDQFGAYWGNSGGTSIYCAQSETKHWWVSNWDGSTQGDQRPVEIFCRAHNREGAKAQVREILAGTTVQFFH